MKLPRLLSLGMMVAGAAAALGPLQRRRTWDGVNRTVTIALDCDDTVEAAVRAGMPPGDLLHQLWHAGASHLAIPEDSLARLLAQGRLGLAIPLQPLADAPPLGGWTYLAAHEAGLLPRLQIELAARLPQLAARLVEDRGRSLLAIGGPVAAVQHVGLGFDPALARLAREAGLQPLPRPASYPWPTATTIERTLAQAAEVGGSGHPAEGPAIVAFQGQGDPEHPGDLVLGHEMQIRDTIAAMQRHRVAFAYFVESRHQRGDWFVAKSLAPAVVLAHEFTPANLVLEDMHSAAHRWGLLAREKGIRLCLLRLFKVVHATTPLDCIDYVATVADVLVNREGMSLNNRPDFRPARVHHHHGHGHHHHDHAHHSHEHHDPNHDHAHDNHEHHGHGHSSPAGMESETSPADAVPTLPVRNTQSLPHLPRDDRALALVSLVPVAAGAMALSEFLRLPAGAEAALTVAGLGAPLLLARLDRPATEIEAAFRPSYAPKLIALGITALSPLAAGLALRNGVPGLAQALVIQASAAMGLAATVAEHEYALRVEEVRTAGLDWIVPLGGALAMAIAGPDQDSSRAARRSLLAGGLSLAGLLLARSPAVPGDLLSAWDQEHSAQHTHHLSRMQAAIGDLKMGMSPRPLRKWTLWALAAQTATVALPPGPLARLSSVLATAGNVAFLAGFRQAGRPIVRTLADRVPGVQP